TAVGAAAAVSDGHAASGVSAPADIWYLAEGSTLPGVQTYVTLLNPGVAEARARVDFGGGHSTEALVPAGRRATIDVSALVPGVEGVGAVVAVLSGPPVVVERPIYALRDIAAAGQVGAATDEVAQRNPARTWYFGEGSTLDGFQTYLLLFNPASVPADMSVQFGSTAPVFFTVAPMSRFTLD